MRGRVGGERVGATSWIAGAAAGLLPVFAFLGFLMALDSFKLVRWRDLALAIAGGVAAAGVCLVANRALFGAVELSPEAYARYVAPLVEEVAKAAIVVILMRAHRIGFLVDAAIFGFAVGAGFSAVENAWYLAAMPDAVFAVWMVRGFGTAIVHGGTTALFAILAKSRADRGATHAGLAFLPALAAATALHSLFNHFFLSPILSAGVVLAVIPACLFWAFQRSEGALRGWLGSGFDADAELLALIGSGGVSGSHVGIYLQSLREKFRGEVVADMVCYLRLSVEVALRAKGELMMREHGFRTEPDAALAATFTEMDYLEKSIGPTGLLALRPLFHDGGRHAWQARLLGRA
jgi:RsiW-degrading membrane proteinase PrsW (M82 family)